MRTPQMKILGTDLGGVICNTWDRETWKSDQFLEVTPIEGSLGALTRLRKVFDEVHIVSYIIPGREEKVYSWVRHHRILERIGIPGTHFHHCSSKPAKAPICERLGVTHFIDDRLEVLQHLTRVPHRFLFIGHEYEEAQFPDVMARVQHVSGWGEILDHLGCRETA